MEMDPSSTVLEVAVGSGGPALYHGARVVGIGINAHGIAAANEMTRVQGLDAPVHFECADASQPPHAQPAFSAVWVPSGIRFGCRRLDWTRLRQMKLRWGVSLAALIRRAFDLGLYTEATYRRAYSVLNQRGWRTEEPDERHGASHIAGSGCRAGWQPRLPPRPDRG